MSKKIEPIVGKVCTGLVQTNSYLLACPETSRGVIIDAPADSYPILFKESRDRGISLQALLLTHSHWDHIADASEWHSHMPVYVHHLDAPNLKTPGADGLSLFEPIEGVEPDGFLVDKQYIQLGSLTLQVLHTPGHTRGSICLYLQEEELLFSGDTLFAGAMGRVDLPQSNPAQMKESLKKLSQLPLATDVLPGHGGPTTIGQESWIH